MSKPSYNHGTMYQSNLFDSAYEYWERGEQPPIDLVVAMANEGMDVAQLEAAYMEVN